MLYAHVTNGTVDQVGTPPATAYADGRWWDLRSLDPAALTKAGWVEAVTTARPADTATTTSDSSWTLTAGKAVQKWTVRDKTADEIQRDTENAARTKLTDDLRAGIAAIVTARNAATADIATAEATRAQAATLSTQIGARKTAVDGATLTLNLAAINALKGEVSYLLATVRTLTDALTAVTAWRKAVDENAVTTDNALLWLAKQSTGDVLANEAARKA